MKKNKIIEGIGKHYKAHLFVGSIDEDKYITVVSAKPDDLLNMFLGLFRRVPATMAIAELALKNVRDIKKIEKTENGNNERAVDEEAASDSPEKK